MQPKINKDLWEIFPFRINQGDKQWPSCPGWGRIGRRVDPQSPDAQFSAPSGTVCGFLQK